MKKRLLPAIRTLSPSVVGTGTDLIRSEFCIEGDDLDDEYDFYLPQTAKLLIEGADAYKIAGYVSQIVRVTIGFRDFPSIGLLNSRSS